MTTFAACVVGMAFGFLAWVVFLFGCCAGAQREREHWTEWYDLHSKRGWDLPRPPFGTITEDLDDDDSDE